MSFGSNEQFGEEDAEINSAGAGRSGASDFVSEGSPKASIDDDIEKNLLIRTMPRKFKVSTPSKTRTKSKAVGAVIMVVGLLVMGAAVYLVYAFLINPKTVLPTTPVNKTSTPAPVKTDDVKKVEVKTDTTPITATSSKTVTQPIIQVPSSTTPISPASSSNPIVIATTTTPVIASSTPIVVASQIVDADSDGISDAEELLLGTNSTTADSDGDGYSDKSELEGLYNPAGTGKLSVNQNILQYKDAIKKYSVFYPSIWRTQGVGDSIIFSSPDNSLVQLVSEPNSEKKSILTWYNEQFTDSPASLFDVLVKNGWEGIYHQNKQIFYLADLDKNNIYTFSYVPEKEGDMIYYNIFQMMINSFSPESAK